MFESCIFVGKVKNMDLNIADREVSWYIKKSFQITEYK